MLRFDNRTGRSRAILMSTTSTDDYCSCFKPDRCVIDDSSCSVRRRRRRRCGGVVEFRSAVSNCVSACRRLHQCSCHCTTTDQRCGRSGHQVCVRAVYQDSLTVDDDPTSSTMSTSASPQTNSVGLAVGLSIAGLVLLILVVVFVVLWRRQRQPPMPASCLRTSTSTYGSDCNYERTVRGAPAPTYEEITSPVGMMTANQYEQITDVSELPSSSSLAAAALYVNTPLAITDNNGFYYEEPQRPVTSSNVAETGDDVTYLTVIDNDLYERQGQGQGEGQQQQQQQNSGSADYELTLIDNDLYR